jgi:hypothetical protein
MSRNSHWWRTRPLVAAALAVPILALLPKASAEAATVSTCLPLVPPAPVAEWRMGEPQNALQMNDSVGTNNGKITGAKTGVPATGQGFATAYRFGRGGTEFPKGSQVVVPSAAELNPGNCNFAVDILVNWDQVAPQAAATYNVTQKGLATAPSNWKMEVDGRPDNGGGAGFGRVICTFDGIDSHGPVRVTSPVRIQPGEWTKLGCERHGDQFIVKVGPNSWTSVVSGIGAITNTSTLTVGAKKLNDSDTFPGGVADLVFSRG